MIPTPYIIRCFQVIRVSPSNKKSMVIVYKRKGKMERTLPASSNHGIIALQVEIYTINEYV
jgi:hypothetical protein